MWLQVEDKRFNTWKVLITRNGLTDKAHYLAWLILISWHFTKCQSAPPTPPKKKEIKSGAGRRLLGRTPATSTTRNLIWQIPTQTVRQRCERKQEAGKKLKWLLFSRDIWKYLGCHYIVNPGSSRILPGSVDQGVSGLQMKFIATQPTNYKATGKLIWLKLIVSWTKRTQLD